MGDMPNATTYLNVGPLLSVSGRSSGAMLGYGVEASLHHFLDKDYQSGLGVFGQWQRTNRDHSRYGGGVQFSYLVFGVELGVAHDTASRDFDSSTSLHLAPFVSAAGFATLSLRTGIPLSGSSGPKPTHGMEFGLVLSVKYPLGLDGY